MKKFQFFKINNIPIKNRFWVGTVDGLNLYNPDKNNFTRYTQGFKNNSICAILDDANNNIWVSTLGGLSFLNPNTGEIKNFDKTDGLQSNEFNPRSAYQKSSDSLFFGGIKGVNLFNPQKLNFNNISKCLNTINCFFHKPDHLLSKSHITII